MPPLSSPVPRLSSAPSDVYTVHTIASRSPPHPLATSHRVREGRPPRPVQGDAIATPRHHIASEQQPQGIASTFCHTARLVLVLFLQVVRKGSEPARAGDSFPLTPSTLSTMPGCLGIYADTPEGRGGGRVDISGRRGSSVRFKVSGNFARLYRSKYQLFIFSEGLSRATPVHRGNDNDT